MENDKENINTPQFLVCVSNNEASRTALRFVCKKALHCGGGVHLLHVVEPENGQSFFSVSDKIKEERIQTAQATVDELSGLTASLLGEKPQIILAEGSIGAEIIKTCNDKDRGINMLVLGVSVEHAAHGKLIAWLSTQMSGDLHVPLMLVPGNLNDEEIELLG